MEIGPRARSLLRNGFLTLALCACVASASSAQEPTAVSGQTVQVMVERVNVGVIVTDANGKFVEGLQRENFQLLDDGAPQPITDFASIDAPGQVLLLVESGPAVYFLQDAHLLVADGLLNGLSSSDRVAVAHYADAPVAVLDFTTDKLTAQAALDQLRFNLGYGDLNLAASLNTVLDWLARVPGKNTIVLVSTGVDTSPQATMQSLLARLRTGEVRILAVSTSAPLRTRKDPTKRHVAQSQEAFDQADAWLRQLAESTGGRAFFPDNAKAIQETYRQIAQLVRHEYSLAFAPPAADGAVHSIEVPVIDTAAASAKEKPPVYSVAHRKAYLAPKRSE
jgi:Ca-activated chloride channel homolog